MIYERIQRDIAAAITQLQTSGTWPQLDKSVEMPEIAVDIPQESHHGDFSSPVAMQLARLLKKSPLQIADDIKGAIADTSTYEQIQVVQPGFINFFLQPQIFTDILQDILQQAEKFGTSDQGKGQKILIEFISANPTGPLTLPNGRGGYLGDVLSNIHQAYGYEVTREYYINDRGRQIDILGESVARRYLQRQGMNVPYPEELYQGDYIADLAQKLELKDYKLNNAKKIEWVKDRIKQLALQLMLDEIQRVVEQKMRVHYDSWFSEKSLYDQGLPEMLIERLKEKGYVYEHDGAWWVKTTLFGDDKDRVAIKSSGDGAYMQGDIALFYHRSVIRKVNRVILILGADHHGYEKRLKAIPQLLEVDTAFDIIFTQMATLLKEGKEVRMSKRTGNFVTIEELIDEVGNDAARFFFLMYSADRHLNFDIDLAKEQSDKNPVYYVQYAHARLCSIIAEVEKRGVPSLEAEDVSGNAERELIKQLLVFPQVLESIIRTYEAHQLTTYAMDLARAFHQFYNQSRVIDNEVVHAGRYALVLATRTVLQKTLSLLGVSAPEKM